MGLIACVSKHTSTVLPSGAARATKSVPTWLAAPGLFSTTTARPMRSCSFGCRMRAVMSVLPPGGKVTTIMSGRSDCASAPGMKALPRAAARACRVSRRFMSSHPLAHGNGRVLQLLRNHVDQRGTVMGERRLDYAVHVVGLLHAPRLHAECFGHARMVRAIEVDGEVTLAVAGLLAGLDPSENAVGEHDHLERDLAAHDRLEL